MVAVRSMSQDPARVATPMRMPPPGQRSDNPGAAQLEKPLIDGSPSIRTNRGLASVSAKPGA